MLTTDLSHLTDENRKVLQFRNQHLLDLSLRPELIRPFLRPCSVRVLMVVDGLDFSEDDFGLATFVRALLDMPGRHVRFKITLAHIDGTVAGQMMDAETRITNRISNFKFDDAAHFGVNM